MNLIDALQVKDTVTENGMSTNSSPLNQCVNLFFQIGAMRGVDKKRVISPKFLKRSMKTLSQQ